MLGAAIALQLLFGIPLLWGVCLTATDVFLVLYLQNRGFRYVEAIVLTLILGIAGCFAIELWMAKPDPVALAAGLIPQAEILRNPEMLYISIGILGATVMPHNLYLHSSIVQTRMYGDSFEGKKEAIRYATIDSTVALMSALFINAAILIMAAAVFHPDPQYREVADIGDAYLLLNPLLGATVASTLFAVALLFSGQNATLTGTLAGQIVMEGFLNLRLRPWLRRLITRLIAIVPAVIVIAIKGEEGSGPLLVLSQVILSLQLPFAIFPLVQFTSSETLMGPFAIQPGSRHSHGRSALSLRRSTSTCCIRPSFSSSGPDVYQHILVAVEHSKADEAIIEHIVRLAHLMKARLLLVHVADGFAARHFNDLQLRESEEMRDDRAYLARRTDELRKMGLEVNARLAMGDPATEIIKIAAQEHVDLIAMSTHGHRFLSDIIHGTTVDKVRHTVRVPVLLLRAPRHEAD